MMAPPTRPTAMNAPPPTRSRDFRPWLAAFGPARAAALGLLLTLPSLVARYGTDDYLLRRQLGADRCPDLRSHWAP
jgi:hypothetical protein